MLYCKVIQEYQYNLIVIAELICVTDKEIKPAFTLKRPFRLDIVITDRLLT